VRSRLADLGLEIFPREQQTPEALGTLVKADAKKWGRSSRSSGSRRNEEAFSACHSLCSCVRLWPPAHLAEEPQSLPDDDATFQKKAATLLALSIGA